MNKRTTHAPKAKSSKTVGAPKTSRRSKASGSSKTSNAAKRPKKKSAQKKSKKPLPPTEILLGRALTATATLVRIITDLPWTSALSGAEQARMVRDIGEAMLMAKQTGSEGPIKLVLEVWQKKADAARARASRAKARGHR